MLNTLLDLLIICYSFSQRSFEVIAKFEWQNIWAFRESNMEDMLIGEQRWGACWPNTTKEKAFYLKSFKF
jgi:hypothetical protein